MLSKRLKKETKNARVLIPKASESFQRPGLFRVRAKPISIENVAQGIVPKGAEQRTESALAVPRLVKNRF